VSSIVPARFQPALPVEQFIVADAPSPEAVEMDVLFVGAGPAGLAGAIKLARLVEADDEIDSLEIGVIDKAGSLGEHNLSGAVVNPRVFRELFPDVPVAELPFRERVKGEAVYFMTESKAVRIPTPPTMRNHGNYAASICEIVRWMGERA
jgi:electron-transferring-flavoprotein dehydrogenase